MATYHTRRDDPGRHRMRKTTLAFSILALFAVLLVAQWATGPYRTLAAIRAAIVENDAAALAGHVDFPALRASLKAQLEDRLARRFGEQANESLFGQVALGVAGVAVDGAVEVMVTPLGLGALMQGRDMWRGAREAFDPPAPGAVTPVPLQDPEHRFESLSRFTATVPDDAGRPVVFVLTRDGLRWRLSDIRLPRPEAPPPG